MVVIGLVAVLPMLFYDLILNKELETDYSKSYILETSWAVNTINNLAGFAGLVDVGLRYSCLLYTSWAWMSSQCQLHQYFAHVA